MQASARSRFSLFGKLAAVGAGLGVVALLFLWFALPGILQSQAEKFIAEKTGHRLTLAPPEFNPFDLSLRLAGVKLSEADGKPLLAFDTLSIDIAAASLPRRTLVFDAIRLDGLSVTLVELPGGDLNWTPFLKALQSKDDASATALPRIDIHRFVLANGKLDFADRRVAPGFSTRVEPLDLSLSDISTRPDDTGQFKLAASTAFGARFALQGELMLNPVRVAGSFHLDDLEIAQLAPYLKNILPAPPAGKAALSASYRVGNGGEKLDIAIDQAMATLSGLRLPLQEAAGPSAVIDRIEVKDGHFELAKQVLTVGAIRIGNGKLELPGMENPPRFAALALDAARIDLAARAATLGHVALAEGRLRATRNAQGQIDLREALKGFVPPQAAATAEPATSVTPAWRYRIDRLDVTDLGVALRDETVAPAADLALENIRLTATGLDADPTAVLPLRISFDARGGGHFDGEGTIVPAEPAVDLKFKLVDLALKPAQPYLAAKTTLEIADGKFSSQGRLVYNAKGPVYRGNFSVRDLRLTEAGTSDTFLAWKNLGSHELMLTPRQLDLGELRLGGLDAQLIIYKDKSINLARVIKPAAVPPPPTAGTADAVDAADSAPFHVNIDRLRFYKGELDFADHSLILPFGTRIHGLRGSIGNLSSRPGAPGQLELDGEVDDYGMARAVGQVDLFNPTDFMDLRVVFRNVEMTRLTPYTATFAGRKIDSGKLSLDLQYKIRQRQLQGENQVVMERLTLGERIESPTAKDLPLDLAIAILQDADGRIDLGLPVAGSLDDPEFSYGQIVWKAIANVLTRIVSAPFRALGALLGGGEKPESIVFEAGAAQPTPPEREKIGRLAAVLAQRPALRVAVRGIHADTDRVALQHLQLRRAVLARTGQRVSEKGDPGPLSTRQPKIQAALEALYGERFGGDALVALQDGFRRANPGQMEQGVAGKMMSRLSGLLREKKPLGEDEVAQLKGADFHALLFERLRVGEIVGDERLQSLAQARGESVAAVLQSSGVAADRVQLLPVEKGEGAGDEVPVILSLEAVGAAGRIP